MDLPHLSFQRAAPTDVGDLVRFEAIVADGKLYGRPLSAGALLREIVDNSYFVIKRSSALIATAAFREQRNGDIYLSNIATLPSVRRQGIAQAALTFLMDQGATGRRLVLAVHPENAAAMALYKKSGFEAVSRSENHFGDGEPRLIMIKSG